MLSLRSPPVLLLLLLCLTALVMHILQPDQSSNSYGQSIHSSWDTERPSMRHSAFSAPPLSEYVLLWSDEFNQVDHSPPDPDLWTLETGCGLYNGEMQCYTRDRHNAHIHNNMLVIAAERRNTQTTRWFYDTNTNTTNTTTVVYRYTSARLTSQHAVHSIPSTLSRVVARIHMPAFEGAWPAFWMLGTDIQDKPWPACGEVDIVEMVNQESIVHSTIHYQYTETDPKRQRHKQTQHSLKHKGHMTGETMTTPDNHTASVFSHPAVSQHESASGAYIPPSLSSYADGFHVYELVWTASHLLFLVDGELFFIVNNNGNAELVDTFFSRAKHFFLVLNIAVGGWWPGWAIDEDALPARMYVDWIRVYTHK